MLITLKLIYHLFLGGNTIRKDNFTVSESMQNLFKGGFSDFENLYWVGK